MIISARLKKTTFKALIILFLFSVVVVSYSYFETRWLETTHVIIESIDIPTSFDGKKIVFNSEGGDTRRFL